ncbi:MAG: heme ABC transporter ATP-binding protein [Anaerolineae bacterium]|nr:heme ABC transporter ATP-binding protein [Anaerolineae bacterium]
MTLETLEVSFKIGPKTLLQNISLTVEPGQVVAVVGPNGAGKSTLLKILSGDLRPGMGKVLLQGNPLAAWPLRERARMRAVLPQQSRLQFPFTTLEVALMGRMPHTSGREGQRDYEIARAALAAADVLHLAGRLYPTLSGGEQQRAQLARVLAQIWEAPPQGRRYLLLDEPTTSLDLAHQHDTLHLARDFARQGVGVLTILHDLNLAAQYADRVLMLRSGRQIAWGPPPQVLTPPLIQAAFDIAVTVLPHPQLGCPLVVSTPEKINRN